MNILLSGLIVAIVALSGYVGLIGDRYDRTLFEEDIQLGAVSYPTSLDTFTNPSATDRTNVVSHSDQHSNANDAIEALQAKVGINSSLVTTSFDYKLSGVTTGDKAVSLTGSETLTNKTLTAPVVNTPTVATATLTYTTFQASTTFYGTTTINGVARVNLGSDATGDIFYRTALGNLSRLGVGTNGQVLKLAGGLPTWDTDSTSGGVKFRGYATTSSDIGSSYTRVFWAEDYDTGSNFSDNTYTAPANGYYNISATISHNFLRSVDVSIYVNGVASSTQENGANNDEDVRYIEDTLYLETGDTVHIYVKYTGSATGVVIDPGITKTHFNIIQL